MTKMFISILIMLCSSFSVKANDIILSKTGNALLDGTYKPFVELNGAMSFIKNTEGVTFKIARFKLQGTGNTPVLGWLISDSNNKEYFAVTDNNTEIPSQGWDIARAGIGLNASFELTFRANSNNPNKALTLTNTPSLAVKIYPNPTLGAITVEAKEEIQRLSLTNLAGQVLLTGQNNQLDLANLPSGVYNLEVQTQSERTVKRIVKQ